MEDPTAEGAVDQGGSDTSSSGGCNSSVRFRKVRIGFPDELGPEVEEEDLEAPVKPNFSLEEKLTADKFNKPSFIKEYQGSDLTISLFQKDGFHHPILVRDLEGLGLKIPSIGVHEIRSQVGSRRYLDVMDVTTQKNIQLTMKEFNKYWDTPAESRTQLLNVISLELSNTKLDPQVCFAIEFYCRYILFLCHLQSLAQY